jgi:hypothetical protein
VADGFGLRQDGGAMGSGSLMGHDVFRNQVFWWGYYRFSLLWLSIVFLEG